MKGDTSNLVSPFCLIIRFFRIFRSNNLTINCKSINFANKTDKKKKI